MTRRALRALVKYDWPGNVRELRNCIEGMVVMSNRTELDLEDLSEHILQLAGMSPPLVFSAPTAADATSSELSPSHLNVKIGMSLAELEKEAIRATLKYAGNNKAKTAKILGISKRTIFRKIADATSSELSPSHLNVKIGMSLAELEKEAIRATLKYAGNNKAKTAKILGISKPTIFRKIKEYDLCDD
jgi:DNA-binding NtrC family response regulator